MLMHKKSAISDEKNAPNQMNFKMATKKSVVFRYCQSLKIDLIYTSPSQLFVEIWYLFSFLL